MTNEWDGGNGDDVEDEEEFGPGSADYDLSEEHGYRWEPEGDGGGGPIPQWAMVLVTLLVVSGLLLPAVLLIYRYG